MGLPELLVLFAVGSLFFFVGAKQSATTAGARREKARWHRPSQRKMRSAWSR